MEWVVALVVLLVLALGSAGGWLVGRRVLQFCPHCSWIVKRVRTGWLRCPRCHKQYGRHTRVRP